MPASNYQFALIACTQEHFAYGRLLDKLRQNAERVHAHTRDSKRVLSPEFVTLLEDLLSNHFVQFDSIALLQVHLAALELAQVFMQ